MHRQVGTWDAALEEEDEDIDYAKLSDTLGLSKESMFSLPLVSHRLQLRPNLHSQL